MGTLIALVLGISVFGLLFAVYLVRWFLAKKTGSEKMNFVSNAIKEGADTVTATITSVTGAVKSVTETVTSVVNILNK